MMFLWRNTNGTLRRQKVSRIFSCLCLIIIHYYAQLLPRVCNIRGQIQSLTTHCPQLSNNNIKQNVQLRAVVILIIQQLQINSSKIRGFRCHLSLQFPPSATPYSYLALTVLSRKQRTMNLNLPSILMNYFKQHLLIISNISYFLFYEKNTFWYT